jgi:hypothetical protein
MLFTLIVILAFLFWFMATWPVPWAERVARGLFLFAALIWAVPALHLG